jgi:hypothetical protein
VGPTRTLQPSSQLRISEKKFANDYTHRHLHKKFVPNYHQFLLMVIHIITKSIFTIIRPTTSVPLRNNYVNRSMYLEFLHHLLSLLHF